MMIREPAVAGQFYPANADRCRAELAACIERGKTDFVPAGRPVGGLVPHAGWIYSGSAAACVFNALAATRSPDVVILLGSVHRSGGRNAALFSSGRWETPLGPLTVDTRLAERILGHTNLIADDPYAHDNEHSIEVQAPFVKWLFPEAKIVPLMVPPTPRAREVGDAVGRTLTAYDYDALVIGTTDLTHYGPRYGFAPKGVGREGNRWAKETNDRRFIDQACSMQADRLVSEAAEHKNACGAGAAAATIAAAEALGASKGVLLVHTTSSEVLPGRAGEEEQDSVGYAGIVFE
jgi:AmmeMemoRadiSam system protein B